ncbi:PEP-CTERM sorting domain-containing protein [Cerasicoccus arenae]|uniref:PEP-CTERM protein-sorting domain-containing protein n=1 Tax=Cerasicoccus arenae TaxID=424488 RepID=A0A8J3DDU8_9BACT|nr:PEP-CTERM sorting domain-containing protein [Cerasicoccus arenae]MBK1857784.1 PEP-CTERM sorting domain-containing protein [Cerasicoccus arenae]GHC12040.1 hypothetical protein GCM10007047_31800 [Cerasicoccus arenae]
MQFSRMRRAGQLSAIALTATLTSTAFGIIQIDNYLVGGAASEADLLNGGPYAWYIITPDSTDGDRQKTVSEPIALGGKRDLTASSYSTSAGKAYLTEITSEASVRGYGTNPGLYLSYTVDPAPIVESDFEGLAGIQYGNTSSFQNLDLDLSGIAVNEGAFVLDVSHLAFSGEAERSMGIQLRLRSNSESGSKNANVWNFSNDYSATSIVWTFDDILAVNPDFVLGDVDQIQLWLKTKDADTTFSSVELVATSFHVVPEPSTYALLLGGAVLFLTLQRKLNAKHS